MAFQDLGLRVTIMGVGEARRQLGMLRSDINEFGTGLARVSGQTSNLGLALTRLGSSFTALGRTMTFGLTLPLTTALGALVSAGIQFEDAFAGVNKTVEGLSDGFNEVAKAMFGTTEGLTQAQKDAVFASDALGQLNDEGKALYESFRKMSLVMPTSAKELAEIGAIAGQLGLTGAENIAKFTEVVAKLSVATDLSAEDAAFAIARIANIYGVSLSDIQDFAKSFGAALNYVGNTSAATESEIVAIVTRMGAVGHLADFTVPDIIGWGSAMAELGVKSERGGTAFSRVVYSMMEAVNAGPGGATVDQQISQLNSMVTSSVATLRQLVQSGMSVADIKLKLRDTGLELGQLTPLLEGVERGTISLDEAMTEISSTTLENLSSGLEDTTGDLKKFADIAGMTEQAFAALFKEDPTKAMQVFLNRLVELEKTGKVTKETLTELGFEGVRVREVMNLLGPNMELVTKNINNANKEWERQISLDEEFAKRIKTVKSQLLIMRNAFADLGITIFNVMHDDLEKFIGGVTRLVTSISKLDPGLLKLGIRIAGIVAAFGPLLAIFGILLQTMGATLITNNVLFKSFGKLLRMPLDMLGLGGLLGGKTGVAGKGAGKGAIGIFGSLLKIPVGLGKNIIKLLTGVVGTVTGGLGKVGGLIVKGITKGMALAFPVVGPIITTMLDVLTIPIRSAFGIVTKGLGKTFGILGGFIGGTIKRLPMFGSSLLQFVLKPLGMLPKLALIGAAAFAVLFGPKIISAISKNRDKISAELKSSAKQFKEDMAKSGLEKAIMLFVSGGSTGSGRKGGLLGIVRAMGASEEHAQQFAYAMGVAAHWIIQIVKDTTAFVRQLIFGKEETDEIHKKAKSTSEVFIAIASALGQFFAGLHTGWTSTFDDIEKAFNGFAGSISRLGNALTKFFDALFGKPPDKTEEFQKNLEKGSGSAAESVGETVGRVLGNIITLALQGLTLIVDIATAITNAFTNLVNAYHAGGVKNVFAELGPSLEIIWDGVVTGLGMLWDNVEPGLISFLTSLGTWIEQTGIPAVRAGAESLARTLSRGFENFWKGEGAVFDTRVMQQAFTPGHWGQPEVLGELVDSADWKKQQQLLESGWSLRPAIMTVQTTAATTGFQTTISNALQAIWDFISSDENKAKVIAAANTVFDWLYNFIIDPGWNNYIKPALEILLNKVGSFATDKFYAIGNDIAQAVIEGLVDIASAEPVISVLDFFGLDKDAIKELDRLFENEGVVKPQQKSILDQLTSVTLSKADMKHAAKLMDEFGAEMSEGLRSGIISGELTAIQAAELQSIQLAHALTGPILNWLGIRSPSSFFMNVGQSIMQGLIQGMSSMQWGLAALLSSILNQFSVFASNINMIVSSVQSTIMGVYNAILAIITGITGSITGVIGTLFGTTNNPVGGQTTNSNVNNYSPTFYGPPAPATYQQNRTMYSQYLMATQVLAQ